MALIGFIKQVFQEFGKDKVGQLSAAFSYGAIFSIGPLLLVLISIIGFVYGEQAAQGKLFTELNNVFGSATAKTIQNVVAHTHESNSGVLALILGIVGMLLGAAGITTQLQNSFNSIFNIVPDPAGGIKRKVVVKIKNALLVVLGGIVVAASLVASALISGLGNRLNQSVNIPSFVLELINNAVSLSIFIGLLYLIYRVLPDVYVPRKIVITAALAVSVLFLIGKVVIGFIIGRNSTAGAYGAAASLVSLLLWIYYSGQILFIGAEGMKVYGYNRSLDYVPKKLSLQRTTIHVDSDNFGNKLVEAWTRGFRNSRNR